MNCTPPSRFNVGRRARKKRRTSTVLSSLMAFTSEILTAASLGKETSVFDLSVQGLVIGILEEMEHCLTVTWCHRPCSRWYTISKMSLKNCKGEIYKSAKLFKTSSVNKVGVKTSCLPVFSNQGVRTLLFLRCLLLAVKFCSGLLLWQVQCTGGLSP